MIDVRACLNGEFEIETLGLSSHDVSINIRRSGDIEIRQDGHGGYNCCSYHESFFKMTKKQWKEFRDFIDEKILNEE